MSETMRGLALTRRQFTAATVSAAVLTALNIPQEAVAAGRVTVESTPQYLIVNDRARCVGCQRCETACSLKNSGKSSAHLARVKVGKNYQFGSEVGSGEGIYGNLQYTQETCHQCESPLCAKACPQNAIVSDPDHNGAYAVNEDACIGCGSCHVACPWHLPTVDRETKTSTKCVLCGTCAAQCPTGALQFIPWEDVNAKLRTIEYTGGLPALAPTA